MKSRTYLADRTRGVERSGIRIMFAEADGVDDVVNLGIGQPDFDTPDFIRDAAKKALDEGYTRYPPAKGFADLRRAIADKLAAENDIIVDPETEVFVAAGAMQVIFNTCLHLLDPGDEVIVIDPGYHYHSQIRLFGGVPVPVPARESNRFNPDPDDIRAAVTGKTRLMIINTPSNPSGAVFDVEILKAVAAMAIEHDIWVLSDEPYEHILFDGRRHRSIGSLEGMKERTISAFTLSKSYSMTGWRIGYTAAPPAVVSEMEKSMEHMTSGVNAVAQRAALAAITAPMDEVRDMVATYEKRRDIVHDGLNAIDGVRCMKPESTFYAFPNISSFGMSSWDFADYMVREHGVAVAPGRIFGKEGEGFVRLSFASSTEMLQEGIARIERGAAALTSRARTI